MRARLSALAAASLALGVFCWLYAGPGRAFVRGHLGDVAAAALIYAVLGLAWRGPRWIRVVVVSLVVLAVELRQALFGPLAGTAAEIFVGGTFDVWDLVCYALGIAVAALVDRPGKNLAQS